MKQTHKGYKDVNLNREVARKASTNDSSVDMVDVVDFYIFVTGKILNSLEQVIFLNTLLS